MPLENLAVVVRREAVAGARDRSSPAATGEWGADEDQRPA